MIIEGLAITAKNNEDYIFFKNNYTWTKKFLVSECLYTDAEILDYVESAVSKQYNINYSTMKIIKVSFKTDVTNDTKYCKALDKCLKRLALSKLTNNEIKLLGLEKQATLFKLEQNDETENKVAINDQANKNDYIRPRDEDILEAINIVLNDHDFDDYTFIT